jgi:hypothetical protein
MQCLTPEQIVSYLRGNGVDPRAVEAHVRDCPACGMELLLARETLSELKPARAAKPATRKMAVIRPRASWIPWAAAAAVFVVVIVLVLQLGKPSGKSQDTAVRPDRAPRPETPKAPDPKPEPPAPKPEAPKPDPKPEIPAPKPEPKPEVPAPKPEPRPEPRPEPPKPEPKPEPEKPKPTIVEKAVVARVTHAVGGTAGRTILAGDTVATARQEFLAVALDGYGQLWLRESTKLEVGTGGELNLHEGAMLARIDSGRRMGLCRTPSGDVELHAPMFHLEVSKQQGTELSVLDGRAAVGALVVKGPSMIAVRPGKAAEAKPLEPGFAGWLPDKLAAKKFGGWLEGEAASPMAGFKAGEAEGARAAVQVEERGSLALRAALPYKGRYVLWLRVRQYPGKPIGLAIVLNGQAATLPPFEGVEGKPWRWVPIVVNSDKVDLVLGPAAGNPFRKNDERRAFPVVLDAALLTTDAKFVPPDRAPEEPDAYLLVLEEPGK